MLPKIRTAFDSLAEAVGNACVAETGGLNVTAPPSFATRWLVPRLPAFTAAYPDIRIRLSSSSDSVDRRGKGRHVDGDIPDPRLADCELSIRYGTGHYPGFSVERLLAPDWIPVCSPRLANDDKPLRTPQDLAKHILIHDETIDGEDRQPGWREWLSAAGVSGVDCERGPRFNNAVLAVEAALDGQGVALALRPLVEADLVAGRLKVPFDLAVPSPFAYFLVMRKAVADRAPVVAFRAWLLAQTAMARPVEFPADEGV
jgi:LysR family glycine cleavage system transcriptional activator